MKKKQKEVTDAPTRGQNCRVNSERATVKALRKVAREREITYKSPLG